MDDVIKFLESRPLVGFHMDGSHLHDVLHSIIDHQSQLQRQLNSRLANIEEDVRQLAMRQRDYEKLNSGNDALRALRQQLDHVTNTMNELQESQQRLQEDVVDMSHENRQLGEVVRAVEREQKEAAQQARDIQRNLEGISRREELRNLRNLLDELSERTDNNFRSVEESARAVDAELSRNRGDINGLQEDVGSLDEKMQHYLSNVARDMDAKCQMILDTLREHERSSLEIEEHMLAAGQALARRKATKEQNGAALGVHGHSSNSTRPNGW